MMRIYVRETKQRSYSIVDGNLLNREINNVKSVSSDWSVQV